MAPPFVLLKFGGTSVASPAHWTTIRREVGDRLAAGETPVLVLSAVRGTTDLLGALASEPDAAVRRGTVDEIAERHRALALQLGLAPDEVVAEELSALARASDAQGALAAPPPVRAELLAFGERLSSRIGAAFLTSNWLDVSWIDARTLLQSTPTRRAGAADWLSAECGTAPNETTRTRLAEAGDVVVTQGFVARNGDGATVVLGRGGSDTAAAYLAAHVGADRVEIWSDVPGVFSADPRVVPDARLLRVLDYREAQEIATTGSRVLHPRCIPALRDHGVPLHLRSTHDPDREGTVIRAGRATGRPRVKAITSRRGVSLVSMETLGMWQEVGFLSRAAAVFSDAGLSLDLISTSETNITVSLDGDGNQLDDDTLRGVLDRLSAFCVAKLIPGCAAVSLVGTRIRELLHRLGPALEAMGEHRVHLMTQASSDLNLTVVVDEATAPRLVRRLHDILIPSTGDNDVFGEPLEAEAAPEPTSPSAPWWHTQRDHLLQIGAREGVAWVYDLDTVRARARALRALSSVDRVFYAMKANPHPRIVQALLDEGLGMECVSPGELARVREVAPNLDVDRILFTPNFCPRSDFEIGFAQAGHVTVDALYPLQQWSDLFGGRAIILRIDAGWGSGHDERVVTGGQFSKFGVPLDDLAHAKELADRAGARIVGLHAHLGSGILQPDHWANVARLLGEVRTGFPDLERINVGGGLGVPETVDDGALDLPAADAALAPFAEAHPDLEIWMEPGRFLVAEAGVLLARVTQVKEKADVRFVGVETGMNALVRPALYGAHHGVVNLSRYPDAPVGLAQVVGPVCESGDRLATDRPLPTCAEGDVILIEHAGAYGRVMSSEYNLRPHPAEIVL